MQILVHTMHYTGGRLAPLPLPVRNYRDADYPMYRPMYNSSFAPMRRALGLSPVNCCPGREEMRKKANQVFMVEVAGLLIGSVAIYGKEIDDLIVAKEFRRKGYGQGLLRFAVARMQQEGRSPISLHVADWNRGAILLYQKNGFAIVHTETISPSEGT